MDQVKLKAVVAELQALLIQHAGENEAVDALHKRILPMLVAAEAGQIATPVPWMDVPGSRPFAEGEYAELPDVEDAYARFKMLVTGSESLMTKP